MSEAAMHLQLLLPFDVFIDQPGVRRIVLDTAAGSYGFLPQRQDCVASLVPGILTYVTADDHEVFVAIDEGTVVKSGRDVRVSVRRAHTDPDLARLHEMVTQEFLVRNEREAEARVVMARMESGFIHRMAELHRD